MPIYVTDDGKYFTQSVAILRMLAVEHGYAPETAKQVYEVEWFQGTVVDIMESADRFALIKDDATEEMQGKCIAVLKKFIEKIDEHWADGRAHAAGEKITWVDFSMLAAVTSVYENPNGKHAAIKEATLGFLAAATNVQRVLAPMRELCAATIAATEPSSV